MSARARLEARLNRIWYEGEPVPWWADLGESRGSGPGFGRPVLILSADVYNRSRIATIIANHPILD